MVHGVLDKLLGIIANLVSRKPGWQDWGFVELIQALEVWKTIQITSRVLTNLEKQAIVLQLHWSTTQCSSSDSDRHVTGNQPSNNGNVALTRRGEGMSPYSTCLS